MEQHFDDLVEFELLEQVPAKQTGDRQYYYELGPKFSEHLSAVTSEYPDLDHARAVEQAVNSAIAEIELEHRVGNPPRTSIHLKDEARQLERPTGEAIEYPPHNLAGGNGKENTKVILGRK